MSYIHSKLLKNIEQLKEDGNFEEALKLVNQILVKDPLNNEALLHIADIEYARWNISKAEKPVDFMLHNSWNQDSMWLYIKWVLEMDKTEWTEAKKYFKEALKLDKKENPEILRCYGLSEYWAGNKERWISVLNTSFKVNKYDAEIIYNLIEINLLEHKFQKANTLIKHYNKIYDKLKTFDKDISYYNEKISLFKKYLVEQAK